MNVFASGRPRRVVERVALSQSKLLVVVLSQRMVRQGMIFPEQLGVGDLFCVVGCRRSQSGLTRFLRVLGMCIRFWHMWFVLCYFLLIEIMTVNVQY